MITIKYRYLTMLMYTGISGLILGGCHKSAVVPDKYPVYGRRGYTQSGAGSEDSVKFLEDYGIRLESSPVEQTQSLESDSVTAMALENNPDVIAARFRLAEARAELDASGRWPNPRIGGRVLSDDDANLHSEGALLFTLPIGGRAGAEEDAAAVRYDLARLDLVDARMHAQRDANKKLARLAHARARLELFESLSARSAQFAQYAKAQRESLMAGPLDVALVLADATRDRRAVLRARAQVEEIEEHILLVIGLPPGSRNLPCPELRRVQPAVDVQSLEARALEMRTSVLKAKLEIALADREAARISAERVPDVEIGPAFLNESETGHWAAGLEVGMEISVLKTGNSEYDAAIERRKSAIEHFHQTARQTVTRVRNLITRLKARTQEIEALVSESASALETALKLAEVQYSAGKLDVLRLLSAHRAYAELKLEYLNLLLEQREILIDLEEAVGASLENSEVEP